MRTVDKTTRMLRRLRSKIVVAIMVSSGIVRTLMEYLFTRARMESTCL